MRNLTKDERQAFFYILSAYDLSHADEKTALRWFKRAKVFAVQAVKVMREGVEDEKEK